MLGDNKEEGRLKVCLNVTKINNIYFPHADANFQFIVQISD